MPRPSSRRRCSWTTSASTAGPTSLEEGHHDDLDAALRSPWLLAAVDSRLRPPRAHSLLCADRAEEARLDRGPVGDVDGCAAGRGRLPDAGLDDRERLPAWLRLRVPAHRL